MAKAEMVLPTGAKVTIEGTEGEIRALLDRYSSAPGRRRGHLQTKARGGGANRRSSATSVSGPMGRVAELHSEGFFATKQTLKAVQDKLSEKGYIYSQGSLSPTMVRLTRRKMLRRLKEDGVWAYVNA